MQYTSNAKWTKITPSHDTHETKEQAQGMCDRLMDDYGPDSIGCEIRGHCIKAWVEEKGQTSSN